MRIAVLSDIHGNLSALKAVLRDLANRQVDVIVNLGDSLSGPLQPSETAAFLIDEVFLCHGTPRSDIEYFLETVDAPRVRAATQDEIDERLGPVSAAVVICGHTTFQEWRGPAPGNCLSTRAAWVCRRMGTTTPPITS